MSIEGRCKCGSVRYRVEGEPIWQAYCHCEDCQRAASADYASWFGVLRTDVQWTGERSFHQSSEGVQRSNCAACGSPMTFESEAYPDETHLYAPSLSDLSLYKPERHVFWSERVPWLSLRDDLPKHSKGSDSPMVSE